MNYQITAAQNKGMNCEPPVNVWLESCGDGQVELVASRGSSGPYTLALLTDDGRLVRAPFVSEDLGLKLDERGRVSEE